MNCATCFLAAAQVFFPAADTKPTAFDGASVRLENNAAVVDVAPRHKFCGVNFVFPKPVALNRYERLSTEISNRTDRALDFVVHGMAKGTHRRFVQGKVKLGPGESAVVMAPCQRRCYTMVTDGDGLPGMFGYDRKYRPDSVDRTGDISSVIVFSTLQDAPAQFDVKRVWAEGEQPDLTLKIDDAFFPFVDEFGQYKSGYRLCLLTPVQGTVYKLALFENCLCGNIGDTVYYLTLTSTEEPFEDYALVNRNVGNGLPDKLYWFKSAGGTIPRWGYGVYFEW